MYLLAKSFLLSGFFINLDLSISRQCFWETDRCARFVFDEPNIKSVSTPPADRSSAVLCIDHDGVDTHGWGKVIHINYDILDGLSRSKSIIAPYWMHPNAVRSSLTDTIRYWRHSAKTVRLLLAGNFSQASYNYQGPLNKGKLKRIEILDAILTNFASKTVRVEDREEIKALLEKGCPEPIVIFNATQARLSREEWFPALSCCEYFLALPGVRMPMSHNLIEAMALGCIPICNYPEWLSPKLSHGVDCLAFEDVDSLRLAIETTLKSTPQETARLRVNVLNYFDNHLRPDTFVSSVLASGQREVMVYVNAEEVSEHAAYARDTTNFPEGWSLC